MSCSTGPLGAVWAGRVGFLRLGLHCRSLGAEAGEDGLVRPGAALGSLLQLFSCCSPAKAGPLQHAVVRLSVVAVVFATFFTPPGPMYQ